MASQVGTEISSTPTLPVVQEGRANLVSPPQGERTPSLKETASQWASDVRQRISASIADREEVSQEDVHTLERELVRGFITALQEDSHQTWMLLREMLALVKPIQYSLHCFDQKAELYHYLERIVRHADLHKVRLFDVQIVEALTDVFPKEVEEIRDKGPGPSKAYPNPSPPPLKAPSSPRKAVKLTLPDGSDPFDLRPAPDDETYLLVKPLTFGDMRKSFGAVAMEVASREAVWGQCLGTTVQALQIDLPVQPEAVEKTPAVADKPSPVITPRSNRSSPEAKTQVTPPRKPMTGREAVQYFAGCHHIGKIETLFFNIAPNRHYRPYDLIEVPENKVDRDHYVFSTFSILHVCPDQPSQTQSLAEWHREAVLWNAISHIPFFKQYLLLKMFTRWRSNKRMLDVQRRQEQLTRSLLHAVPRFGAALIQITRLLKELVTVNFLPFEADATYTIANFENLVHYKNVQADKTLEKFFKYCKLAVDVTAEESFKRLAYCEEQVKKKTVFSKDSLHLQRLKKEQREANLEKARAETGRLGNFVKLIDQMVVEHLFEITKTQVIRFVNDVMKTRHDPERDGGGLVKANLIFNKNEVLGLSPSKEKILSVITGTLTNIPSVLCARAMPMDATGGWSDHEDSASVYSSHAKSTGSLIKVLEHKRKKSLAMTPGTALTTGHGLDGQAAKGGPISEAGAETQSEAASHVTRAVQPAAVVDDEDDDIELPDLPRWAAPTKEEDEMGVATPDLVMKTDACLVVEGEGFMGQYEPLSKASLEEKLRLDEEYLGALDVTTETLEAAMLEVEQYCEANAWLNQIHQFSSHWTERSVRDFKGVPAFTIEQQLNEIRQWSDRIRAFDQSFLTENGLIYVDCVNLHSRLLPGLEKIYQQLITFVAEEAKQLAKNFCKEISFLIYTLKDKRKTVEAFASYAKSFNEYKKNTAQYHQQLDYIKSLFEVIRMSYRQLSSEEERLEENVWQSWEAFLFQMQAASEFVNTQTPLFSQELEDTYTRLKHAKTQKQQNEAAQPPSMVMVLEREAYELAERGTSGKFLDPEQKPTAILADLKEIRMRFFAVREQLTNAGWRREAISGEPYDLTFLSQLTKRLDIRYELWKYVEVSMLAIKDWKQLPFNKFNTKKALEKMVEWQTAAGQLKVHLPPEDAVLAQWFRALQDFKQRLPMLHKLHHESLKDRHWRAIFVGIGDVYDPKRELLLNELLEYKFDDQVQFIDQICQNALAEFDLEVQIMKTAKFWNERDFKLAKHIPDSIYNSKEYQQRKRQDSTRRSKLEKFRKERAAAVKRNYKGLDVTAGDFYILVEVEQLQYELEDSQISVHAMLHSPHLAGMEQEVKFWFKALHQIQEITELWLSAQQKWLYLLKVFEMPEMYKKFSHLSFKFEAVTRKFKDYMRLAASDPKCLNVVNHKRGERGYRVLQGDNLRKLLSGLITTQEEILKQLDGLLDAARLQFPRLFFLSNWELVETLGVSRNPQALLPAVSKCFPGVTGLDFSLPSGMGSVNSTLDYALHADKLCATALTGSLGEAVVLTTPLEASPHAPRWLSSLEKTMRNTLAEVLQATVQARMEDGSPQPVQVLRELARYNRPSRGKDGSSSEKQGETTLQHWLLRHPVQCVLISESVLWERSMSRILEKGDKEDLSQLCTNLQSRLEQYADILREEPRGRAELHVKQRLRQLVTNLVNQGIYTRDVTQALKKSGNISPHSFDWLKVLKYHIEIKSVLRAKTEVSESLPITPFPATPTPSPGRHVRLSTPEADTPVLTRTKTTVSSAYSFSQCFVHMLGTPYSYDYEYLGPTPRLVVTPLTERAFLSLTSSLQSFHCGALVGPPTTGKSETIGELSKALGRHLVTVACNEDVSLPMMSQYLSGAIQTGSWLLFDNAGCLTTGLMSVFAQQLDYLRTALKALSEFSSCQYNLRGQPRYDKFGRRVFYDIAPVYQHQKPGVSDKVIRRNSLTTLHPLPSEDDPPGPLRQNTVPHGFNEKGLSTYFEDRWVEEREERRHSIEKEILIKESELYKSNKPPPLFYEHVMFSRKKSSPDYSKLGQESSYQPRYLGNMMFNGNLMLANANYGCFMTFNSNNPAYSTKLPQQLRVLIRPCALVVPDTERILEVLLCSEGFDEFTLWTSKLCRFLYMLDLQFPGRWAASGVGLREMRTVVRVAGTKRLDKGLDREIQKTLFPQQPEMIQSQTPRSREEFCLVKAIRQVISPKMENDDDNTCLLNILRDLFPATAKAETHFPGSDPKLTQAIKELLKQKHQFCSDAFIAKILQLQSAVDLKHGVILAGPTGSGKTTCYKTLANAWNNLNYRLFAPDHSKEELDIHRMIRNTDRLKQKGGDLEETNEDPYNLEIRDRLTLKSLQVETTQARKKWFKAEKSVGGMLSTTLEVEGHVPDAPQDQALYPKVDLFTVTPNALTTQQLFGSFEDGIWEDGILTKILRGIELKGRSVKSVLNQTKVKRSTTSNNTKSLMDLPSNLLQWLVLDGAINPLWSENLNTLLDEHRRLNNADRENICNPNSATILFETTDLSWASPAMVARTTVVHFEGDVVNWRWLIDSWCQTCNTEYMMTAASLRVLDQMVSDVFGPTLKFLAKECLPALLTDVSFHTRQTNQTAAGIQEVTTFLKILASLLNRFFLREDLEKKIRKLEHDATEAPEEEPGIHASPTLARKVNSRLTTSTAIEEIVPNHLELVKSVFAFSYIWAFGGHLHDRYKVKFDRFARDALFRSSHPVRLPAKGLVYDFYVDGGTGGLVRWPDKPVERPRGLPATYIVTPEVDRYQHLLDLVLSAGHSVHLTGATGVGKTSLIQNLISSKHALTRVQMSSGLTSELLSRRLTSRLQDPPAQQSNSGLSLDDKDLTFFIDDLHTAPGQHGVQPPLEVLRQLLTEGGVYDLERKAFLETKPARFLTLSTLPSQPGTSSHVISARLTRLLVTLTFFDLPMSSILSVISKPILSWLEEFPTYSVEHHKDFATAMASGLYELYRAVKDKFRPTPSHAHYLFSFHDIATAVQGILLMSPRSRTRKIRVRRRERDDYRRLAGFNFAELSRQSTNVSSVSGGSVEGAAPMMKSIAQLWCHECTRVFADRLIATEDVAWYQRTLESIAVKQFCSPRAERQAEMEAIHEETQELSYSRLTPINTHLNLSSAEESCPGTSPMMDSGVQHVEVTDSQSPVSSTASPENQGEITDHQGGTTPLGLPSEGASPQPRMSPAAVLSARSSPRNRSPSRAKSPIKRRSSGRRRSSAGETDVVANKLAMSGTDRDSQSLNMDGQSLTGTNMDGQAVSPADHETSEEEEDETSEENLTSTDYDTEDSDIGTVAGVNSMEEAHNLDAVSSAGAMTPQRPSKQTKRGVTFKMGLIQDGAQEEFDGPLMTVDELKGSNKYLTDVLYSKHFMRILTESKGSLVEKGYVETSESQMVEALYVSLRAYNLATSQHLDLAFFTQAVQHAARLSRVMSLPGGHALLLGVSYSTGRGTLTKLAAFIAQRKVFEPKAQPDEAQSCQVVRQHVKRCCHYAGITRKPAVLLIHEALGRESLQDVTAVMTEGTCPGLYTEEELQELVSEMMPGGVQIRRPDKIDQAFERFLRKVRQNLHVVVCLNYRGNSFSSDFSALHSKLEGCPGLLKGCVSVDMYREWDRAAYVTVADRYLRHSNSKIPVPWNDVYKEEQINLTSAAMGFIHTTAKTAAEQQYSHHSQPLRFYTPLTFMEFTRIFRVIAAHLAKREQTTIEKYQILLDRMNTASATIAAYKREVSELTPQHTVAKESIQQCLDKVEDGKTAYIQQLDDCKKQEEKIAELQKPMEVFREKLSSAFMEARPSYEAAKIALTTMDDKASSDLGELKSYRQPPVTVKWVVGALCVLFDRPESWESGKLLLMKDNLISDLIFYDKENVPAHIFNKLEGYVRNPCFQPKEVRQSSAALACICAYIHAVYQYAVIHKGTFPLRQNLEEAIAKVEKAQTTLGQMRLTAGRRKTLLEKSIDSHKEAVTQSKTIDKRIAGCQKRIRKCDQLMTSIKSHHMRWKSAVKKAKVHIDTAPADALIAAACVCYFGPLDDKTRAELLQDWIKFCRTGQSFSPSLPDEGISLEARLQNFMADSLSVHSQLGSTNVESNAPESVGDLTEVLVDTQVEKAGQGSRPATADSRMSQGKGDNPPTIHVYPYRPSIQESSLGKVELRSEFEEAGSTHFSMETEESDEEGSGSPLLLREDFSLRDILSDLSELQDWKLADLPTDAHAIENALILRVCSDNRKHFWPLLIDPDSQAEAWIRALQHSCQRILESEVIEGDTDTTTVSDSVEFPTSLFPLEDEWRRMSRFSDVTAFTEYTLRDDSSVSEYRTQTSVSNVNKDDLRPLTSVTHSWEKYSGIQVEEQVDTPTDNMWVVEADHPLLNHHLLNAVVHGVTILVTHLERKPLDPVFRGILFKHQHLDSEGNPVVKVGGAEYRYHPSFRLYLSTSTPLFMKGDGLFEVPIQKMCVIHMGLSDEAIVSRILHETMAVEKKDFHTQLHANNNDLVQHNKLLARENEVILEKVLTLSGPVLRDKTIVPALDLCEQGLEKHRSILEETNYVRETLEQKRRPYGAMAQQVATLYALVRKMSLLHPLYYLPFSQFVDMFQKVLRARDRGKGVPGDILARTQELSDAMTARLYKFVNMMMFEKHAILFSLLVSMERMRLKGQLTNEEMALFINGFEVTSQSEQASPLADKPDWMSNHAWRRCVILESLHPSFEGLQTSLTHSPAPWEEYFTRPLTLMNPVPGDELKQLTVFQKCLLWKIYSPDKLYEVTEALVVYELGAIIHPPEHYNITEVYKYTDKDTPAIFVYPDPPSSPQPWDSTRGFPYVDPLHELKRLAREEGMEGRLRILNFGVHSQMAEVTQAIEDCMNNGYWILLENYHLAEPLNQQTFQLLKTIVNSRADNKRSCSSLFGEEPSEASQSVVKSLPSSLPTETVPVCDSFRLFLTTSASGGRLLPGILIQRGVVVSCESTQNFRSTLHKSYRNVAYLLNTWLQTPDKATPQKDSNDKSSYIMPLALLHAVLLQRRYYGNIGSVANNHWSVVDLVSMAELFKSLAVQCNCMKTVSEVMTQVYANHCTDLQDAEVTKAIGAAILNFPGMSTTSLDSQANGCAALLPHLLSEGGRPVFNLKAALDSLHELSASTFSLPDTADQQLAATISRVLARDLVQSVGAPELLTSVVHSAPTSCLIQQRLALLEEMLGACPELPSTTRDHLYPLDIFFHYEAERYKALLKTLREDLGLLHRYSQGEITLSPDLQMVSASLVRDEIPEAWLRNTLPSASCFTEWIESLPSKLGRLVSYVNREPTGHCYHLSTFLTPCQFLQATLSDHARQQFQNADLLHYKAQVMPASFRPTAPPTSGLYLTGLRLHNAVWDSSHAHLTASQPDSTDFPVLPVVWLSPCGDTPTNSRPSSSASWDRTAEPYSCPVFGGSRMSEIGHSNLVTRIALPTGPAPNTVWSERRVYLSCE